MFKVKAPFKPTGDQSEAIKALAGNLKNGVKHQVLLGVTGSGKTATMSWVIEKIQRPALIIEPNKVLAAQIYQELKELFPQNAIHFFVSYYDYYQPEAYIPQRDLYIEKDAKINEEIDKLRHGAVQNLLSRNDVIVIASVSCIFNLGSPQNYQKACLELKSGKRISRQELLSHLIALGYQRNDFDFKPGVFRVRGNTIEIFLITGKELLKIELAENRIAGLLTSCVSPDTKYKILDTKYQLFPSHFWVTPQEKLALAMENIRLELQERIKVLRKQKKFVEAQRLEQRTNYDLEMIQESGYCHGIENYSRHMEFRKPGQAPFTLIDYLGFNKRNFLIFIDESHLTCPQIKAMAVQDKGRKKVLIDYGFRLPSAIDNRPLNFEEFIQKIQQVVYVSATPQEYEKRKAGKKYIVEQLVRPTGLLEPSIEIRPTKNQINDLIKEIKKETLNKNRVLVITLTKRLAEDLTDYLKEQGILCQWLHSETKTMERPEILKNFRQGKYDVLVGINLLREGLDLPEVSLVAILDADKEGFLRSSTTLIQTMGRTARHLKGRVILYADKTTYSMNEAIKEVKRRRKIQENYNKKHGITPRTITKKIREWPFAKKEEVAAEFMAIQDLKLLEKEMLQAAQNLDFERAAQIRDLIKKTGK